MIPNNKKSPPIINWWTSQNNNLVNYRFINRMEYSFSSCDKTTV